MLCQTETVIEAFVGWFLVALLLVLGPWVAALGVLLLVESYQESHGSEEQGEAGAGAAKRVRR